jgi:ergothioneine biosynthesis protein EgtB
VSEQITQLFRDTRSQSVVLCAPLNSEDYTLQAEAFTSPPKWHLAHTTWFFETFLLKPFAENYATPEPRYEVMFNSYYNGIGEQFPRGQRGLLSRPTVSEVLEYRAHVDAAMMVLINDQSHLQRQTILSRTTLGVEHERQHQELFFTDLKYSLAINPLLPTYVEVEAARSQARSAIRWHVYPGGLVHLGYAGEHFCFDNELPRHQAFVQPFELADRLVTNAEYQGFIADGGYQRSDLWLADGWEAVQTQRWQAPQYWIDRDGEELEFTLHGLVNRSANTPVCHVSGYEADAYARWSEARLPTEQEWELAASAEPDASEGIDGGIYHPRAAPEHTGIKQLYGSCWQWTSSAYSPYPGYQSSPGAIGEYNGKFMSNQWVLRGGSCVSKAEQVRSSYRNFFYPPDRWQFSGIRLARNASSN